MSFTQLKLAFQNETKFEKNFTDYKSSAEECMNFFEGVYAFGCPGKRNDRSLCPNFGLRSRLGHEQTPDIGH